ncbi:MAG TPA: VTT domain-containing protein [Thermoanaerobaculia bacterium]|nr:VTT domain-containing protein [Thermoanaerobaculia bacterium]
MITPVSRLSNRNILARFAVASLLCAAIATVYFTPAREWITLDNARRIVGALRSVWYGPLVFMALYAFGCVVAIPATVFVISAGIIWGAALGGVYALLGGSIGALGAYWIARFVGAGLLPKLGRHGIRAEKQLEKAGFKSMLILRLLPVFPFAVLNYAAGVARMGVAHFYFGTLLGAAPAHFIVTYSADALASGKLRGEDAFLRLLVVGTLLALLALVPMMIKKRLEKGWVGEGGEAVTMTDSR